ncbi:hypothetical protein [Caballeronia sp. DA-9]|uniref:hypothetical protein n=1 Tax=Caballeronia sp. DA-9 TaxID=3436237 RepID=UPI003F6689E5
MTLKLHENCLAQLAATLTQALGQIEVRNRMFLGSGASDRLIGLDAILPQTGKVQEALKKYIGESPFVDFVSETLSRELFEQQVYESGEVKPLSEIEPYADLGSLASRLVTEFNSLPWQYTVTAALPAAFSRLFCEHVGQFDISDTISIRKGESLKDEFPLISGIAKRDEAIAGGGLLSSQTPAEWKNDTAYLQIRIAGFCGKYSATEPQRQAIDTIRSFFGICIAQRLMKPIWTYNLYSTPEKYYVHRHIDGNWIPQEAENLETRHSELIRCLVMDDLNGHSGTDESFVRRIKIELNTMSAIYRNAERAKHLILAAQWLLDSYCGNDELLQFVQAAVVVEILLGDKASSDQTGLGELLSNRCAYLIAKTHTQRAEILVQFRQIYDIRSKIVHRGKSRLTVFERSLLGKLRWLCFRIIQEEAQLIETDEKAE